MLPDKIEIDPDYEDLGVTAEYIRKLNHWPAHFVGTKLGLGERAVYRREQEGSGLRTVQAISHHFDALGYETSITLTRKVQKS